MSCRQRRKQPVLARFPSMARMTRTVGAGHDDVKPGGRPGISPPPADLDIERVVMQSSLDVRDSGCMVTRIEPEKLL